MGLTLILMNTRQSNKIRGFLLKPFFKKCGKNFQVAPHVTFIMTRNIVIGNNVYIAHSVWINGSGGLNIGDGVIISPMVVIATTKHRYIDGKICNHSEESAPINIGSYSWIVSNSVITKGINIGKGCIVSAASAVTRDVPDYWMVGGVPARPIKRLYNGDFDES
jgi:acetyltransferase-like isoleucine patch superfamily enzyme